MSSQKTFAELLVYYRSKADLTQDELSQKSGISKVQIARYETNNAKPRLNAIMKLAKALGVTEEDLGYKTTPKASMIAAQTEARILLGILELKDKYLDAVIMQRKDKTQFEDMVIKIKQDIDKNQLYKNIEQIAKANDTVINLQEIENNVYSLSIKFKHLNISDK